MEAVYKQGFKGTESPWKSYYILKIKSPSRACKGTYTSMVWAREGVSERR